MNDFNEPGFLAPTGLFLGSTKYMVIQGEPGAVIRGKKVTYLHLNILCLSSSDHYHFSCFGEMFLEFLWAQLIELLEN